MSLPKIDLNCTLHFRAKIKQFAGGIHWGDQHLWRKNNYRCFRLGPASGLSQNVDNSFTPIDAAQPADFFKQFIFSARLQSLGLTFYCSTTKYLQGTMTLEKFSSSLRQELCLHNTIDVVFHYSAQSNKTLLLLYYDHFRIENNNPFAFHIACCQNEL